LTPLIEKGFKYLGVILETYVIPKVNDMIKIWKKHKTEIKEAAKIIGIAVMAIIVIIGLLILIIGGALVGAFVLAVTIADKVTRAFDRITSAIKAVRSWLINTIPGAKSFGAAFHTIVSKAVDEMKKLPGQIKNVVTGAPQWLYSAGRSIIKGLINGIKDSLPSLGDTLKGVGSFIKNMKGPKAKDLVMLRPAGNWIMQGLKRGIKEKLGDLKKTLTDVSNTIHMSVQPSSPAFAGPPPGRRPPPGGAMTTGKTFNQTINVHTQEINPTKQAAQMGWELSNRMG
jgi:phage-related protein